jgi:hypothetical protein
VAAKAAQRMIFMVPLAQFSDVQARRSDLSNSV